MSRWNHSICEKCWNTRNPEREPVKLREEFRDEKAEPCCYCGVMHCSGIYLRDDPSVLRCKGNHSEVVLP